MHRPVGLLSFRSYIDEKELIRTSRGEFFTKFHHVDGSIRDVIINRAVYSNTEGNPAGLTGIILDITAQRDAERKITEQVKFLGLLIETIPNPVYYRKLDGTLIECNRAYAELFGKSEGELVGTKHFDLFKKEQAEVFHGSDRELLTSGNNRLIYNSEIELPDGRKVDLLINKTILYDTEGKLTKPIQY